ncbi:MAG: hypothetical protein JJU36_07745 [Phycisphaeraceae bacterium]|nr:hypothetical protein [Phycisphaeraceae bacterium]
MAEPRRRGEGWATRIGVILAVTGSAVGLGNFLRFPGIAAEYGGGAFMIPYVVALLLLGIPIALVEWTMGRYGGRRGYNSSPGVFAAVTGRPRGAYLGILGPVIPIMIFMFYVVVEAWCLGYAWYYLTGQVHLFDNPGEFFDRFTGADGDFNLFRFGRSPVVILTVACFVLNFFLIYRGLNKGIELFCKIAMPLLVLLAILVLIRVVTLPANPEKPDQTVMNGLGYMWNPVVDGTILATEDDNVKLLYTLAPNLSEADQPLEPEMEDQRTSAIRYTDRQALGGALALAGWRGPATRTELDQPIQFTVTIDNKPREFTLTERINPEGLWRHQKARLALEIEDDRVVVRSLTFFQSLANAEIWLAAAGQIFFSLSVGFGIVITYASYIRRRDDIALSAMTSAAGNSFCEVALGAMIAIPAAFVFLGVATVANPPGTFGMGFVALPGVFAEMPLGRWVGFLFFFLLFLAAVTSSISMLQPAVAFLEEGLNIGRKASSVLLIFITGVGAAFVMMFSAGYAALSVLDFWVGTLAIYLMATIQIILFGWVMGLEKGMKEMRDGAEISLPSWLPFVLKYVSPTYLLIIFALWLVNNLPERLSALFTIEDDKIPVHLIGFFFVVAMIGFVGLLLTRAVYNWTKRERMETEVFP